ncbi:ribosomal protein L7/L12 [Candidatus Vidania fulgoroideorum]
MKKVDKIFEEICSLNLLELKILIDKANEKFGNLNKIENFKKDKEEKKIILELTSIGDNKISSIRMVKDILKIDLMKAKKIVDNVPQVLLEDIEKKKAEEIIKKFSKIGCICNLK